MPLITNSLDKYSISIVLISYLAVTWSVNARAENSFEFELDPYYTNAGYYISFTDKPIPEVVYEKESNIYRDMLDSIKSPPRFLLIEASINPLPAAGAYIKNNHEDIYNDAQLRGDLNVIQSITEGFEEPYALSLFLGSIVRYVRPDESETIKNRGYTGYLLSIGDKHILSNTIVDDNWVEFEIKFKGDQNFKDKSLSWSLRAGAKIHQNRDITDVIHFGLRRNHFDSKFKAFSYIDNSDIEYKLEFNKDTLELVQQELFINKKWPIGFSEKSVFSFGIGFIIEKGKYSGLLAREADDFRFIFRPNLQF